MIVNFFTTDDFVGLLSRSAMLPLIVFSILFGFATKGELSCFRLLTSISGVGPRWAWPF